MKKVLLMALVVGMVTTTVSADRLSMEFRGEGKEVTMAPSDYVTIDIWLTPGPLNGSQYIDNVAFAFETAGDADPSEFTVVEISTYYGWTYILAPEDVPTHFGFFADFYVSAGGDDVHKVVGEPIHLLDIRLHKDFFLDNDVEIWFREGSEPTTPWLADGGSAILPGTETWGDNFYEVDQGGINDPLIVHNIPEPATLALLALGGLALLRRR